MAKEVSDMVDHQAGLDGWTELSKRDEPSLFV